LKSLSRGAAARGSLDQSRFTISYIDSLGRPRDANYLDQYRFDRRRVRQIGRTEKQIAMELALLCWQFSFV
jgi:hypothetical protein